MNDLKTVGFVRQKFREYYERRGVQAPSFVEQREFGFGNEKKIDYRHFAFKSEAELRAYLVSNAPLFASVSVALYKFPDRRPMEKKESRGAELAFEFDSECEHGLACEPCLEGSRQEMIHLIEDFLVPDFGFSKKEFVVSFSGMRGYHVRVTGGEALGLSREARRQIADYVQGRGLNPHKLLEGAPRPAAGWQLRLGEIVKDIVSSADAEEARKYCLVKKKGDWSEQRRQEFLAFLAAGNFRALPQGFDWDRVVESKVVHLRPGIDDSVTLDTSKLIRLPSTLHGGSGLLCCCVKDLDAFAPFRDAVVFGDTPLRVRLVKNAPAFCLKEQSFGPFAAGVEAELPEFAALFLLCKGLAASL